ncbi:hypothetical protein MTO96_000006 [Rhipicephalus appendiculatus]
MHPPGTPEKPSESSKLQMGADAKVPKENAASIRTSEELKLSPTVYKIGRSLNDIGGSPQVERRRRNSWGTSGIPKLSSNPLVAALAPKFRRAAFNRVKPAADKKRSSASQTGMN